ncbi:MAG: bactofilin family protein [Bradymonadia bacterium]
MFGRKENKDETSKSQLSVGVTTAETLEERHLENREMEDTGVALLRREDMQRSPATGGSTGALLGRGCRFEGKLTFEGTVQIDGEFFGDIDSPGHLVISAGARIDGTVNVASADISGEVNGKLTTSGALELRQTAKVVGELSVQALVIERGAHFEGQVQMTGKQ